MDATAQERQKMLMRIRSAAQLTLPAEVRKALNVKEGDYLEASIAAGGVLLKPVAVVERERAWSRVVKATAKVKDRKPKRKGSLAGERAIARAVKALRRRHG
jgi:AbrB family looped-hinge helix DNA binding protein